MDSLLLSHSNKKRAPNFGAVFSTLQCSIAKREKEEDYTVYKLFMIQISEF